MNNASKLFTAMTNERKKVESLVFFGKKTRHVHVVVGQTYLVQPLNPLKKKHRGRVCTVLKILMYKEHFPCGAEVKFADNGRRGRVELDDLVPVMPSKITADEINQTLAAIDPLWVKVSQLTSRVDKDSPLLDSLLSAQHHAEELFKALECCKAVIIANPPVE